MKKSTWIILVAAAALAAAAYIAMHLPGERSLAERAGKTFVEFDPSLVETFEIVRPTSRVVLAKVNGDWVLQEPVRYPADTAAVASTIRNIRLIELNDLISANPAKQGIFRLDSTGTHIRLVLRGGASVSFRAGKQSATYGQTYVRKDGANEVYAATGVQSVMFERNPNEWRDKAVVRTSPDAITDVVFHYGDTSFAVTRVDTVYMIGRDTTNQRTARTLLAALASLTADDFVDTALSPPLKPLAIITVHAMDGTASLSIYQEKGADKYAVREEGKGQTFVVNGWRLKYILLRKKALLSPLS
jgi:hypothetical protein